jgi:2-polyprenyl-6-methoxyphenol hydroxylase-like FAD-dependent oxidoreductase
MPEPLKLYLDQMLRLDVAIIGASAAGLFTALQLAQKGVGVRVFEAKESFTHFR